VAAIVAVISLVSACGSSGTAVTAPFGASAPRLEHGPVYEVKIGNVSGLGPIVVDGQGITLYLFRNDHQGSPSRCNNICAVQWTPVTLTSASSAPLAGPGIEARLLGTAPRTDGSTQITYNGWPLYRWPPDRSPGAATGQALTNAGGRWYVINAAGNAVQQP
jgi:predicted lipoprotein with Yx(FWY)xxD motif